jgi:hypothetical protein
MAPALGLLHPDAARVPPRSGASPAGRWSRFRAFLYAPSTSLRYLRGESLPHEHHHVGHNPLGAARCSRCSASSCVQVATGLVADDEIATTGPLIKYVSSATERAGDGLAQELGPMDHPRPRRSARLGDRVLLAAPARRTSSRRCGTATSASAPTFRRRSTTAARALHRAGRRRRLRARVTARVRLGG